MLRTAGGRRWGLLPCAASWRPHQCVELPAGRPVLPGILISVLAAGNQPVAAVIPRGRNLINLVGRQELGQTHPAATNIIGAILGRRPNFWGKSFTFFLKQKITKIANFSGCWGSAPDPAQHPKLRAAGAGRDGSLVGGDAGRARAPNPARIGATGRYPHLSSPRHLSTPHLPSPPLPTPACFLGNTRGSPRRWRLARALSASGAPPRRSRPHGTTVRSTVRCHSPTKPPAFHMPG